MSVSGRRLVVTGAASGIGLALADVLQERGAGVVGIDRDGAVIDADVSRPESIRAAIDEAAARLGGLDGVVNCAGIMRAQRAPLDSVSLDDWHEVIAVNLTGSFLVAQAAVAHLGSGGVIVLVGSRAGVSMPSGSIAYGASKGGVHGLGLTLAEALAHRGIRVHTVLPGDIDTPLMRRSLEEARANGVSDGEIACRIATLTSPAVVAESIAWLLDPAAEGVTGTVATR